MFTNLFKAAMFHTQNGADKAAIKGYGAGYSACHTVARAAIAGMKTCSEGKKRHQDALNKRASEWEAFQASLLGGQEQPQEQPQPEAPVEPAPQQPSNGWTDITDGSDEDEEVDLSHAEF